VQLTSNVIDRTFARAEPAGDLLSDLADEPVHVEVLERRADLQREALSAARRSERGVKGTDDGVREQVGRSQRQHQAARDLAYRRALGHQLLLLRKRYWRHPRDVQSALKRSTPYRSGGGAGVISM
jgi:hypothetical protein